MPMTVKPKPGSPPADEVRAMFAEVAPRYDFLNTILSGGLDRHWRRGLVRRVRAELSRRAPGSPAPDLLDLATGSGVVAFALRRGLGPEPSIVGLDFCEPMLGPAHRRLASSGDPRMRFGVGDCLALPVAEASADAITIAFGLRNLADRARGLAEMRRVLRPDGFLCVLEFTRPDDWFSPMYFAYLRHVLPRVAALVGARREAYEYLGESIEAFPDRPRLARELLAAGFDDVRWESFTFGTVALHTARVARPA